MNMRANSNVGEINFTHWRGGGGTAIGIGTTASHPLISLILGGFSEVVACHCIVAIKYVNSAWVFFADWQPTCKQSLAVRKLLLAHGSGRRLKLRDQRAQGVCLRFVLRHRLQRLLQLNALQLVHAGAVSQRRSCTLQI